MKQFKNELKFYGNLNSYLFDLLLEIKGDGLPIPLEAGQAAEIEIAVRKIKAVCESSIHSIEAHLDDIQNEK